MFILMVAARSSVCSDACAVAEWNDHNQPCQGSVGDEAADKQGLTSVWNSYQLHCHYWRPQCTPK